MTSRAERRRADKAEQKAAQYKRTKFIDRATYQPFAPSERTGSLHNGAYTAEELHQRAVERRDRKRDIERAFLASSGREVHPHAPVHIDLHQPPHKPRGTYPRPHFARKSKPDVDWKKPQPVEHMHSAARTRHYASITPAKLAA